MKRLNPNTGKPFVCGDTRADGFLFHTYRMSKPVKADGFFREMWRSPQAQVKQKDNRQSKRKVLVKAKKECKPKNSERNSLIGRLKSLLNNAKSHAKQREHAAPEVTIDDLFELWSDQRGLCAYTNWPMTVTTGSRFVASLERIDSTKSYEKDNVVLICWCANSAKGVLSHKDFVDLCIAVADKFKAI